MAKHRESVAREKAQERKEREQMFRNYPDPLEKLLQLTDTDDDEEENLSEDVSNEDEVEEDYSDSEEKDTSPTNFLNNRVKTRTKKVEWNLTDPSSNSVGKKVIRFSHSNNPVIPSNLENVQTPGDIYRLFGKQTKKSILKNRDEKPLVSLEKAKAIENEEFPKLFAPPSSAVSEKIVERQFPAAVGEHSQKSCPPVTSGRVISRFRKERSIIRN